MKIILIFAGVGLLMSSCAFHSGTMSSNAQFGPDAEIVDFAYGKARTVHVFLIGGLNSETLVRDAKRNMYSAFPLKKGQAYANLSVDFVTKFFPFVRVTKVNVTADIIEQGNEEKSTVLQEVFETALYDSKPLLKPIHPVLWARGADSLVVLDGTNCVRTKLEKVISDKKAIVRYSDGELYEVKIKNTFLLEQESVFPGQDFRIGDYVGVNPENNPPGFEIQGIVEGVNPKDAILYVPSKKKCFKYAIRTVQKR
jgi:hypothetical protein